MKDIRLPFCTAVIVAGGNSVRFGADKLFADLEGVPVLGRTILAFAEADCIQEIVVVARQDAAEYTAKLGRTYGGGKISQVVFGGKTRVMSAYAGVMAACERAELIAIHDGARPLVTQGIIRDAVWAAYRGMAAAPAVPVRDTIKVASDGTVTSTPDRSSLFSVQTPQVFRAEIIKAALADAVANVPDVTDDCAAAERIGAPVTLTAGSEENIKITTPLDLELAEAILRRRCAI
jgi:2-C-methyl-D-erythritol 4-phosphate cytidylyltransferase